MNNSRNSQTASVMVPVLLLILTIVIAIAWGLPNEQSDLGEKSLQLLSEGGFDRDNYTVKFSGRDAYLEGANVSVEEVERAATRLESISGVRKVSFKAINYTVGIDADTLAGSSLASDHQTKAETIANMAVPVPVIPAPEVPAVLETTSVNGKEQSATEATDAVDDQGDAGLVSKAVGMLAKVSGLVTGNTHSSSPDTVEGATLEPESSTSVVLDTNEAGTPVVDSKMQRQLDELMMGGRFLFRPGSIHWPPYMHQALVRVANIIKANPDTSVEIASFSVPVQSAKFSKNLSKSRASQVHTYLVYQGVNASQLSMHGYGFDPEKMRKMSVPSSIRFLVKGDSK